MHRLATVHARDNQRPTTNDVTTQPISISTSFTKVKWGSSKYSWIKQENTEQGEPGSYERLRKPLHAYSLSNLIQWKRRNIYQTAPFSMNLNDSNLVFKVTPFFDTEYLTNGYRYGHSYYRRRIGNRTQAFEWHQLQWHWVTTNPPISRSRYYSTSNNSKMVQDRAIFAMVDQ